MRVVRSPDHIIGSDVIDDLRAAGTGGAKAQDGRQLIGGELLQLLPGKTATGRNRSGEWKWILEAGGEGWQVWDSGAQHAMTWSIDEGRLCIVFSAGKRGTDRLGKDKARIIPNTYRNLVRIGH